MAIIYSYPQAIPKGSDLIIGTVTYDPDDPSPVRGNPTRSFKVSDLAGSIQGNSYTLTSKALGANSAIVLTDNTGFVSGLINFNSGGGMSVLDGGDTITITNTGVLSNVAGTGISLSGTTGNVTITNTGVISVNTVDSTYINLAPNAASNGVVTISAELSATGTPTGLKFLRGDNVWAVPGGGGTVTSVTAGTDISVTGTADDPVINNTAPDQVVTLIGAGGISITGTYPNFNIDSSAISGNVSGTGTTGKITKWISTSEVGDSQMREYASGGGPYPNYFPNEYVAAANIATVEFYVDGKFYDGSGLSGTAGQALFSNGNSTYWSNVAAQGVLSVSAGAGISVSGTSDVTITNDAPDQVVTISGSGGTNVSGSYPNFSISSPNAPDLSNYVQGSGTPGQLTMWDSSGNAIEDAPIDIKANGNINIGALTNSQGSGFTSLIHTLRMYNRLYVGSTGGSGNTGDVLISTGATTDAQDGLDWSPVADYLKRQTTDISTFDSVDNDVTLGGGSASDTLLASQLAIKTYIDNNASGGVVYQGGYDATTNTPDLTTSPNSILKGWMYTVTVEGTFYGETLRVGDVIISNIDNPSSLADWTTVQSNIDLATAGTTVTATRGLAGFNEENFTVTNGFVTANSSSFNSTISTSSSITHGLNTRDVIVQLYDSVTFETIYADVVRTSTTQVTVNFGITPTNPIRVLITKAN